MNISVVSDRIAKLGDTINVQITDISPKDGRRSWVCIVPSSVALDVWSTDNCDVDDFYPMKAYTGKPELVGKLEVPAYGMMDVRLFTTDLPNGVMLQRVVLSIKTNGSIEVVAKEESTPPSKIQPPVPKQSEKSEPKRSGKQTKAKQQAKPEEKAEIKNGEAGRGNRGR